MTALALERDDFRSVLHDRRMILFTALAVLLVLVSFLGLGLGATGVPVSRILSVVADALAGATNVASSLTGWKALSDEGLIAAAPDAIVMMNHGPGGAASDPFTYPAFAATPAAAQRRLIVMDSLYLLGFGPRTPAAARDLMAALHPDQILAAKP